MRKPLLVTALALGLSASAAQAQTGANLEERLQRLERLYDSRVLMQMQQRLDEMQQEINQLRGELERQAYDAQMLKKRQRELYLDTDRRLREIELRGSPAAAQQPAAEPAASEVPASPAAEAEAEPAPTAEDTQQARLAYDRAFNTLKEGRYGEARKAFAAFLQSHPQSSLASNASYWMGEAAYVLRDFDQAMADFRRVIEQHPGSAKVADALLKLGYALYEKGDYAAARQPLEQVMRDYSASSAARLAEKRLQRMNKENR